MSTIPDVIGEIRDRKTRTKLESGVFELHLRSPHPDALQRTVDFCQATGDYHALSAVDIKVMALAVSVEMEKNGTKFLKGLPATPKFQQAKPLSAPSNMNFYEIPKESTSNNDSVRLDASKEDKPSPETVVEEPVESKESGDPTAVTVGDEFVPLPVNLEGGEDQEEEGWITPDNFTKMMLHADKPDEEDDRMFVACCTTDFAMQVKVFY